MDERKERIDQAEKDLQKLESKSAPPAPETDEEDDGLPPIDIWSDVRYDLPEPPEEVIGGILRMGHKMLFSGPSKSGKSFLMLQLAIALSEGKEWLGFPCRLSKTVYVNLELPRPTCLERVDRIYEEMEIREEKKGNLATWTLRGKSGTLDSSLTEKLIKRFRKGGYEVVILDPIYKITSGDENNATEMAAFCKKLDEICHQTGAAVIYCHHHSKGYQAGKSSIDRASGSGVFARDADAILDMLEEQNMTKNAGGEKVCKMEATLREFASPPPFYIRFKWPLYVRLTEEEAERVSKTKGSEETEVDPEPKERKNGPEHRKRELDEAYEALYIGFPVSIEDLAKKMEVSDKTALTRVLDNPDEYNYVKPYVVRKKDLPETESAPGEPNE